MPKEYDNTNTAAAWPNKDKKTDKHPDFTGNANFEGTEYRMAVWYKEPKEGSNKPVLQMRFTLKEGQRSETGARNGLQSMKEALSGAVDPSDEIPF